MTQSQAEGGRTHDGQGLQVQDDQDRDQPCQRRREELRTDEHVAAVDAVGHDAAQRPHEEGRQVEGTGDEADLRGRGAQLHGQPGDGHQRHPHGQAAYQHAHEVDAKARRAERPKATQPSSTRVPEGRTGRAARRNRRALGWSRGPGRVRRCGVGWGGGHGRHGVSRLYAAGARCAAGRAARPRGPTRPERPARPSGARPQISTVALMASAWSARCRAMAPASRPSMRCVMSSASQPRVAGSASALPMVATAAA